ncbi:hypothetical protein [Terrimonas alba]|uniref:hypothetical protein n=1 Tax=Terrimonas alba TaxID=3349636 RepID=UPI0035F40380
MRRIKSAVQYSVNRRHFFPLLLIKLSYADNVVEENTAAHSISTLLTGGKIVM